MTSQVVADPSGFRDASVTGADDAGFDDFADLDLLGLLDTRVSVATMRLQSSRETPAIVTVITRDDIRRWGARDLVDILQRVPGFEFATDVQNAIAPGVRGLWAQEGKLLVLLDGIPLNEHQYSTSQYGFRVPVELIERIEIIRGPGSVLYGGYAELGVVQITTRRGAAIGGGEAHLSSGLFEEGFGFVKSSVSLGERRGDLEFDVAVAGGYAHPSARIYEDFGGESWRVGRDQSQRPLLLKSGLQWQDLRVRLLAEDYVRHQRDGFGESENEGLLSRFSTVGLLAEYDWHLDNIWTLMPLFSYVWQQPWYIPEVTPEGGIVDDANFLHQRNQRWRVGARLFGQPLDWLHVLGGVEYFEDHARALDDELWTGKETARLRDVALYAETTFDSEWVDLTMGARAEIHSQSESSFVPRLGLTTRFGDGHAKLLVNRAFRAPGIQNFNLEPDVQPEETTVFEAELGWILAQRVSLALSGYRMWVDRPIVYFYDERSGEEAYVNADRIGSAGVEFESVAHFERGGFRLGYAWYRAMEQGVDLYAVPGEDRHFVGFAPHKWMASGHVLIWDGLQANAGFVATGRRFGYFPEDRRRAIPELREADPTVVADLGARWVDLGREGFELALHVHNLLDAETMFLQAFDGGHAPLPGRGRQWVLAMDYRW